MGFARKGRNLWRAAMAPMSFSRIKLRFLQKKKFTLVPIQNILFQESPTRKVFRREARPSALVLIEISELSGLSEILERLRSADIQIKYRLRVKNGIDLRQVWEICGENGVDYEDVVLQEFRSPDDAPVGKHLFFSGDKPFLGVFRTSPSPVLSERYLWELDQLLGPIGSSDHLAHLLSYLMENGKYLSVVDLDDENIVKEREKSSFCAEFHGANGHGEPQMHWRLSKPDSTGGNPLRILFKGLQRLYSRNRIEHILLVAQDSLPNRKTYEERESFTLSSGTGGVKVLAYYLPQFYETEDNNRWWGQGFTEWTNVQAARPLFLGHEQRKLPHPSIGQYRLDSPDILRVQAEQMGDAGVFGMIFYHYWFSGKKILEKPAEMLLAHTDIQMRFCFCWANENWTRKWDGNDSEILLEQSYSEADAREFIRALIPFFRDARHITVDGRPLIFIYRPSLIPGIEDYIKVWSDECVEQGISVPYVVTVLTRGAKGPKTYGADAAAERVLFDWTQGAVRDMISEVHQFEPMGGSVLLYDEVAKWYQAMAPGRDGGSLYRSIIPGFDNTARYGPEAFLVHESSPQTFQQWLSTLVSDSKQHLNESERFVIVNAWNEWAEGAYLEPDLRNGWAYLNSVGRALEGRPYDQTSNLARLEGLEIHLSVEFSPRLLSKGRGNLHVRELTDCVRKIAEAERWSFGPNNGGQPGKTLVTLYFRRPGYFGRDSLRNLVSKAIERQEALVVPRQYSSFEFEAAPNLRGTVSEDFLEDSSVMAFSGSIERRSTPKTLVQENHAVFFPMQSAESDSLGISEPVTVLVRVHAGANLVLLEEALLSVASQTDCQVQAHIMSQGFSDDLLGELQNLVERIRRDTSLAVETEYFVAGVTGSDLRSEMLNQGLRNADTRFVSVLDYDDILLEGAYSWLISRIKETGKSVALGRVFETGFDEISQIIAHNRPTFTKKGVNYRDFLSDNFIPIHSLMFDKEKIDFNEVNFHFGQKYMEDYYLLLQVLSEENTDWEGLAMNHYVGCYRFTSSGKNTLALDENNRRALSRSPEYILWEQTVFEFRRNVRWAKMKRDTWGWV